MKTNELLIGGTIVKIRSMDGKNGSITLSCQVMNRTAQDEGAYEALTRKLNNPDATKEELKKAAAELIELKENEPSEVVIHHPTLDFNSYTETEDVLNNFVVGDHVRIRGYAKSYRRLDKEGNTRQGYFFYIRTIEKVKSKCESAFGIPGKAYPVPANDYFLTGEIRSVEKLDGASAKLIISPYGERNNEVPVVVNRVNAGFLGKYRPGTLVHVHAIVESVDNIFVKQDDTGKRPNRDFHIIRAITIMAADPARVRESVTRNRYNKEGSAEKPAEKTVGLHRNGKLRTTFEQV